MAQLHRAAGTNIGALKIRIAFPLKGSFKRGLYGIYSRVQ